MAQSKRLGRLLKFLLLQSHKSRAEEIFFKKHTPLFEIYLNMPQIKILFSLFAELILQIFNFSRLKNDQNCQNYKVDFFQMFY